jgi:hypothetical protein
MRAWALALALASACVPPCPDTYPLCVEADAGTCRAWPASCCMGIAACIKGTMIVEDAGTCAIVETPPDKRISCQ